MYKEKELINDQFEVQRCLIGGMAYVYIVFDHATGQTYALKTLKDEFLEEEEAGRRFEREARTWINLGSQSHIVRAISFFRGRQPLLLLEYVDGASLDRLIRNEPAGLDLGQLLSLAVDMAEGLAYAHNRQMPSGVRGVIHRDLKPSNIMITRDCDPKLTDFGLARAHEDSDLTSMNRLMGTLPYMPPEQFVSAHDVTEKADIYSLGVVLYEMVTANLPFPRGTLPELYHQVHNCQPEPIETYRPDVEPALVELIMCCLEKEPNDRPASAMELTQWLTDLRSRVVGSASQPACHSCGYVPSKQHLLCPVCHDSMQQPPPPPDESTLWLCACGQTNLSAYRFCICCQKWVCRRCFTSNACQFHYCSSCGLAREANVA